MLELGEGTDMIEARKLWPRSLIRYILDTYQLLHSSEKVVRDKVIKVIDEAGSGPLVFQLPVEWGTPMEILDAVYHTVLDHNEKEHDVSTANIHIANLGIHT